MQISKGHSSVIEITWRNKYSNSFFSNQNSLKDNALIDSRDKVNKKLSKKDAIFLAAQGVKRN
jgi:hypothetical protein